MKSPNSTMLAASLLLLHSSCAFALPQLISEVTELERRAAAGEPTGQDTSIQTLSCPGDPPTGIGSSKIAFAKPSDRVFMNEEKVERFAGRYHWVLNVACARTDW